MKLKPLYLAMLAVSSPLLAQNVAVPAPTLSHPLVEAIANGTTHLNFRYRYEFVGQDNTKINANAHTLRTRLSYSSAPLFDLVANIEFDHVAHIGASRFYDFSNGKTQYSVVADPEGADLNQANLSYKGLEKSDITFGRQRINHANQRFMGGVGWRQNEQTFDSARINYNQIDWLNIDYSYTWQVNRIFGPGESIQATTLDGDTHALLIGLNGGAFGQFGLYGYQMDFKDAAKLSNQTLGVSYNYGVKIGDAAKFGLNLAYAQQQDAGDNATDYSARYYNLELNGQASIVKMAAGIEVLGSDDGLQGFQTPLATLHKFQGFADVFLTTPKEGVQDAYANLGIAGNDMALIAFYHDFKADEGNAKWGSEIDLVAKYKFNKNYNALLKLADYSADELGVDTQKVWLQLVAAL